MGIAAPVIFIAMRLLQGLALGGEYGGAATYVAEHAPHGRRGFYTSWIQTTATLGLFLSLLVILGTRTVIGEEAFANWGWRVPFVLSLVLLLVSLWIRMQLSESPAFQRMKAEGKARRRRSGVVRRVEEPEDRDPGARRPDGRSGGRVVHRPVLCAVLHDAGAEGRWQYREHHDRVGLAYRQSVLCVLRRTLGQDRAQADHHGGCLIAALLYFPIFKALTHYANPALEAATARSPITVIADPNECSFQFNPVGTSKFTSSCDIAKSYLSRSGLNYENQAAPAGTMTTVKIGDKVISSVDGKAADAKEKTAAFEADMSGTLKADGYPPKADPAQMNKPMVVVLLTILVIFVTMVYGPIAAMLVEMFPTRIRYTSMSLPYHIGNGWFGGFLPATAFAIVAAKGDIYSGLWYPIIIALATFVIGMLFIKETKDVDIYAND